MMICAIALLLACGRPPEERCQEKTGKLDSLVREAEADILRQKGECQAVAYEFQDQKLTDNCIETLQLVIKIAQTTRDGVAKRRQEKDDCATH